MTLEYSNSIYIDPKKSASLLPKSNGVYIFKDKDDRIVYVGKAKNLKSRVSSYFTSKETRAIRIKNEIYSIDFIVSENEEDALILENDLIKKNKFKSKDRFRNSIITNESQTNDSNQEVATSAKIAPTTINTVSSFRLYSLGAELKLIGLIGSALVTILVITSFII